VLHILKRWKREGGPPTLAEPATNGPAPASPRRLSYFERQKASIEKRIQDSQNET
jgi:U3 small nucleolar ribonucleoprotein component